MNAYVFPGTAVDLSGLERGFASKNPALFDRLLSIAGDFSGYDLKAALAASAELDDKSGQYFTYAFSCAAFETFAGNGRPPSMAAGYSMGVYAACKALGAFTFETGLEIIRTAYDLMSCRCRGMSPGMGGIIGLAEDDVRGLLPSSGEVEIANVNNANSMVITGSSAAVGEVLRTASKEGALSVRTFPASLPYHHSMFMKGVSADFANALESLDLSPCGLPLFSCVDRTQARSRAEIISALASNLDRNIRWGDTVEAMAMAGADVFIEPGPGLSLSKIHKFVLPSAAMISMKSI